jgi:protein-disulfide isomerase
MSSNKKIIVAAIVAGIVVAGAAAFMFTSTQTNASVMDSGNGNPDPNASRNQEIISRLETVTMASAPALGSADAEVTIVEFGDYQCTWCHRWHQSTKDSIVADYVDTGKVRFLFKDFPINDHADRASSLAAEASYCAADQGKYWDYHDELYVNWKGENNGWVTKDSLKQFASNVGLDGQQFSECLDSGRHRGLVRQNYELAVAAGLSATPSFIVLVDGETPKLIRGAHPYSTFQQVIDPVYAN